MKTGKQALQGIKDQSIKVKAAHKEAALANKAYRKELKKLDAMIENFPKKEFPLYEEKLLKYKPSL